MTLPKKAALIVCTLCAALTLTVSAHPGRTDENGGHWDRKNGTYHFHTGENAGRSSSGSASEYSYEPFTPPYEPPTNNPYRSQNNTGAEDKEDEGVFTTLFEYVGIAIIIWYTTAVIFSIELPGGSTLGDAVFKLIGRLFMLIIKPFPFLLPSTYIKKYQQAIDSWYRCCKSFIETESEIYKLKTEKIIPDGFEVGGDKLPKEKGANDWGDTFTVYTTKKGNKIHARFGCSGAVQETHIYRVRGIEMCRRCGKNFAMPDLSWYEKYLNYRRLTNKQKSNLEYLSKCYQAVFAEHKKCNTLIIQFLLLFSKCQRALFNEAEKDFTNTIEPKMNKIQKGK